MLDGHAGHRVNRNALCLVEPDAGRFDSARAAARRSLAVEALLSGRIQVSPEQRQELTERLKAAESELRTALAHAYVRVQVPSGLADDGSLRFSSRELATILAAGRGLHERVREALDTHVAVKLYPAKVAALAELGTAREWRWVSEVAHALPQFLDAPKVWTPAALAVGIAEGVHQGVFGYVAGATDGDGSPAILSPSSVRLREPLAPEQVELGEGAVLLGVALAERLSAPATTTRSPDAPLEPQQRATPAPAPSSGEATGLHL